MPTLTFTSGADSYTANAADNFNLSFLAGADTLTVLLGSVAAAMGTGNDLVSLQGGTSIINGDAGDDRFEIYVGATVYGNADNDLFNIRAGSNHELDGGLGNDRFNFAASIAGILVLGGPGNDDFAGYDFATTGNIHGEDGDDLFTGFRAGVTLHGELGDDTFRLNPGSNATFVEAAASGTDSVQVMRGTDYTLPANIEDVVVGSYAGSDLTSATITLNALANAFTGHGNAETVNGLEGDDRLNAKAGDDVLLGGGGDDLLDGGAGNDGLAGGAGNDRLIGRTGDDNMAGGPGNDIYYVDSIGDTVLESILGGIDTVRTSISLTLSANVEDAVVQGAVGLTIHGNTLHNQIIGNAGADVLYGEEGDDILRGGGGDDELTGGTGSDTLQGGSGDDSYVIVTGDDTVVEAPGAGTDIIWVAVDNYTLPNNVENGHEVVLGSDYTLFGNTLGNELTGSSGNEHLQGLDGNDILNGGSGNDILAGGNGNDAINGGNGNDLIDGNAGTDILTGGAGNDMFRFLSPGGVFDSTPAAPDTITDFETAADVLNLAPIDANSLAGGDQAFVLNNTQLPAGAPGDLWYIFDGPYIVFFGDVNGDSTAEFQLRVDPVTVLLATDIIF